MNHRPKKPLPKAAQGLLIATVLGVPLGLWLGFKLRAIDQEQAIEDKVQAEQEAAETAQREAAEKAAVAERAAKIERLHKETCTPKKERAFKPIIGDRVGSGVTVDPFIWGQLAYLERVGIAGWVSLCMFDGETAFIKHWQTGENLAMWSIDLGYVNTE